jgi:hypothetical protein
MLYDVETRKLIAAEHAELLRAQTRSGTRDHRARRWLSSRLIAAGERLAAEPQPRGRPVGAV